MNKKKVFLVTGGNGFIGSHMCKYLVGLGHDVHIIDNASTSCLENRYQYGTLHLMDICDRENVRKLLSTLEIDCVFHFAARSLVNESEQYPFLYYNENFTKTLSFLESCQLEGIKDFVFSSTCAVFGLPERDKMDEGHPKNPVNTYGRTKLLMEQLMRDVAEKGLMNMLIFRYFNASGCDPEGELGEHHEPETHLIPNLCKAYLNQDKLGNIMEVFGNDYPTRDGTCVRDFIHVQDLVVAHYQGSEYLKKHSGIFDFNLGTEKGYTILEVIQVFEKMVGEKISYRISPRRLGDPHCLIGDSQKAKKTLGFECHYPLEDSLRHTLSWLKKQGK